MRVIAGKAKGHTLRVSKSGVRPTSERVRESIFNRLTASQINWESTKVLDLFAGSGAFAIEALSRGATTACAVEKDTSTTSLILDNATRAKLQIEVIPGDVTKVMSTRLTGLYNLVFIDPPYEFPNTGLTGILLELKLLGILEPHGTCIVERSSRTEDFLVPAGFELDDVRNYGDTRVFSLVW